MEKSLRESRVLIIGGGFGGVQAALDLARRNVPGLQIDLISNRRHLEYYPALYKVVAGGSPHVACIPLPLIFGHHKNVTVHEDSLMRLDAQNKIAEGISGTNYSYDFLVLALGSETTYFNIEGIEQFSHTYNSINRASALSTHIDHQIELSRRQVAVDKNSIEYFAAKVTAENSPLRVAIIGAGPSGVELAATLAKTLPPKIRKSGNRKGGLKIDLVDLAPRVLPTMPESVSAKVQKRLEHLGVNLVLNHSVSKADTEGVYLSSAAEPDLEIKSKTIVWTAGAKVNRFYKESGLFPLSKNGKVTVNEYLEVLELPGVFIIGDAADTPRAGLAQTAVYDGRYVARLIAKRVRRPGQDFKEKIYSAPQISYVMPVGKHYAAFVAKSFELYGFLPAILRELINFRYFISILPLPYALKVFTNDHKPCKVCIACMVE